MSNSKFKYELQRGSKHVLCPECGKKTFKLYVLAGTNQAAGAKFGRCERINSCGYILYPDTNEPYEYIKPTIQRYEPPKFDIIPRKIVEETFKNFDKNVFFQFLIKNFGTKTASELQQKYNIGTARTGGTIFWQKDLAGQFRTGKIFFYNTDGKRNKRRGSWYLHKQVKPNFQLQQVFFGEHLIPYAERVALCESEKTAILMSIYEPQYTWVASGGANMLGDYQLSRLKNLAKVYPDDGCFHDWEAKTKHFSGRKVDVSVMFAVQEGKIEAGSDILDLYFYEKQQQKL